MGVGLEGHHCRVQLVCWPHIYSAGVQIVLQLQGLYPGEGWWETTRCDWGSNFDLVFPPLLLSLRFPFLRDSQVAVTLRAHMSARLQHLYFSCGTYYDVVKCQTMDNPWVPLPFLLFLSLVLAPPPSMPCVPD